MKILFFGDVVGKIGRQAIVKILPELKKKYQPDVILANAENLAHGKGITAKTLFEMKAAGIDAFTSGNHVWKKADVTEASVESDVLLATPLNDPRTDQLHGLVKVPVNSQNLLIVNLLGRVFMNELDLACPFTTIDQVLLGRPDTAGPVLVDIHAEATSEKMALGWYMDGRVGAVLGTHTHIPTADYKILPKGTAYVTDVGMVGPVNSVLGVTKELVIEKFLTDGPIVFKIPETGEVEINAIYLELDDQTNLATGLEKVRQYVTI